MEQATNPDTIKDPGTSSSGCPSVELKSGSNPAGQINTHLEFNDLDMTPQGQTSTPDATKQGLLSQGSLWKAIWIMTWPLMLTTVTSSVVGMVDVQVSGILGSASQAAVGLSEQILFMFLVFILSVGVGATALVSRAYGAGDMAEAQKATAQSLVLSMFMGGVLCIIALLAARLVVPFFSKSPEVITQAQLYLSIFGFYLIPFSVVAIVNASFRAIGNAKIPLMVVLVMTTLNILGDYATVVGNWPFAGLGVRGIALSAVFADSIGVLLAIWQLRRSILKSSLDQLLPFSWDMMKRIIDVGIPSALQRLSWAAAVFGLFFILARCPNPTAALASWTIGMRIEGLVFMPLMALSLAVSSIVGQNLGAGLSERAFKAGWNVTAVGIGMMMLMSIILFVFAPNMAAVMSHDPITIGYVIGYLRINALSEPLLALGMVLSGALQGAGETRTPMWTSLFCNWIIRLPLAWLLSISWKLGPTGAWIAMASSVVLTGVLIAWRYQSKAWLTTKV